MWFLLWYISENLVFKDFLYDLLRKTISTKQKAKTKIDARYLASNISLKIYCSSSSKYLGIVNKTEVSFLRAKNLSKIEGLLNVFILLLIRKKALEEFKDPNRVTKMRFLWVQIQF